MKAASLYYLLSIGLAALAIAGILHFGSSLPTPGGAVEAPVSETVSQPSPVEAALAGMRVNLGHPLGLLFLQLLVIVAATRLAGMLFMRLGQPAVVGEMAAGILLGPSLFGWLAPGAFSFIFPESSMDALKLLSQVGVCLFMFAVGMELDGKQFRTRARAAVMVSHAGIVLPCVLGVLLAYFLYNNLAAPGATFVAFALFLGVSMSITAFPVLARILQERGLTRTPLGGTALTSAAIGDVTAWSLLAFVVAVAGASSLGGVAIQLLLVSAFVVLMVWGVRKALPACLGDERLSCEEPSRGTLAAVLCIVVAASLCTEAIGIHALFGAFLAGAVMPDRNGFRHKLNVRVENFSSVLLLPLFFAYIGLRTQFGLLEGGGDWLLCLLIIVVATVGKLGGSALAARFTGMNWRESLQLGSLMNTRGLMELIALNIGYDLGILSPRIFTMLVLMALVTTLLTGPLLAFFGGRNAEVGASMNAVRA